MSADNSMARQFQEMLHHVWLPELYAVESGRWLPLAFPQSTYTTVLRRPTDNSVHRVDEAAHENAQR
jgi:hypothetical protein